MKEKREFRCPHSFYRSLVRCVKCDAAEKPTTAAPAPAVVKPVGSNYESKVTGRIYRCGVCGQRGHSRTTCSVRRGMAKAALVGRPNLKTYPIPAEHAEPAPKRTGTR